MSTDTTPHDLCVEAWKNLQKDITKTCKDYHRLAEEIQFIAVSKTVSVENIRPLLQAGQSVFAENRVQEATEKWSVLRQQFKNIELHLIGPLQSNKTAQAVKIFDVIQTVDREKIAKNLSIEMQKQKKTLPCYIQVNLGLEPQKSGIAPQEVVPFVARCKNHYGLDIIGLMAIPPVEENPGPYFALLAKLAKQADLQKLSMGMSNDFKTALQFGSNVLRIGSALFGKRPV
ncbi:YggS family pyridoxal phosphate enzyme [Bartonella henselae]|uniref:Pyridoxal phosphate homeostasis protein n=1 Tax=Bartonella henselae (strain ATCC 49882 / DSM 28221 / CCUG 30454 / Houston 1) TaxID=283166 RepID=A0A0H3M4M9_BARHE|nr:YggS family pyridoxal phosphate-dependent enzyme [Bartonella henselae]ATP12964.1 YggS family pyridoxal phosphate enzyme [Bartonella henselae]ETS04143.1 YggS family pyridoxal phosphate enzyme [Bartonella henselae JK 50]ETS04971.1 YggS family pyridoxal phosphate enzyme [Bartonella henselae JK 51]ETS09495.1 YggS family pyridoxal phosphate enzyme [Bartonella henselae JK 42]ETS12523.1 YggS family pyridoxal phosphate enzyme [Bartonella henselae JK 41]